MGVETWEKKPAIKSQMVGCLNCGGAHESFQPDNVIGVGFGFAALTRDGDIVHAEDDDEEFMTGAEAEKIAEADPHHDWRIVLDGPLSGRTYQRHGPGEWVLIAQNNGFA